jgi:hypothetical protein
MARLAIFVYMRTIFLRIVFPLLTGIALLCGLTAGIPSYANPLNLESTRLAINNSHPDEGKPGRTLELVVPEGRAISAMTEEGILVNSLEASTPDGLFSLRIEQNTQLRISNENRPNPVDLNKVEDTIPWKIEVTYPSISIIPPYPQGWIPVSLNYEINGVTDGCITGVKLDKPSTLVFKYNETVLPETVEDLCVFYYNCQSGWTRLSPPAGFIAEGPDVAAEADHFSLFVVLAKPGLSQPPANITIKTLTVEPQRILVGQSSDVRIIVDNKGGLTGDYFVVIKLNGKVQKTQTVHLGPGQSTEVDTIMVPGTSGIYTIAVGPLDDILVVEPRIVPDVAETDYWWLLCIAAGISTLLFSLIRRRTQGKEDSDGEKTGQTKN